MAGGIKKTPLFDMHIERGAKMAPFAGWNLPLHYYEGVADEHLHTREAVSVMDSCHAGKFRIAGKGAAAALDARLACPVLDQAVGTCRVNFLLNEQGVPMEELLVCAMAEEDFFVIGRSGNRLIGGMLQSCVPEDAAFQDLTELLGKIDLLGPVAEAVLIELDVPEEDLPGEYGCKSQAVAEIPCILIRHPLLGEDGFELCFAADYAEDMWEILLDTDPVLPVGQGAGDSLRIEAGQPRCGSDLPAGTSILCTEYASLLRLDEFPERNFVGKEALAGLPADRRLVRILLEGRRAARSGSEVRLDGKVIGKVTGGAFAPSCNCAVALGWVDAACAVPETAVEILAGDVVLTGRLDG